MPPGGYHHVTLDELPQEAKMDAKVEDESGGCPFSGGRRGARNRDWWPEQLDISMLHRNSSLSDPMGKDFDYAKEFKSLDLNAVIEDLRKRDDGFAGLVAGRLRPLWRPDDPHGLAQRRHLPHHRRPRRRGAGPAALRPAELLAGQRQPRQGAPADLAGQAEVRPQDLLGRPDGAGRQRRARDDGLQDVRLRRRPRRRVGAGGALLGPRGHLARRRALFAASASSRSRWPRCRWA